MSGPATKYSLDVIQVREPCPEPWDRMTGDDEVRFCGTCRMNVYNLSEMTRQRAETLLAEREGRLCVRFYRRADGTVTTADCAPVRFAALRKAARRTLGAAAAVFVALLGLVTGLGLFRLGAFDLDDWIESSPIGALMKWNEPVETAGAPMFVPEDEVVMGDYTEPTPEPLPHVGPEPAESPAPLP